MAAIAAFFSRTPPYLRHMKHVETWDEFLKRHRGTGSGLVDWSRRRAEWLVSLETLYGQLSNFLAMEKASGLVTVQGSSVQLREDYLGDYEAPALFIHIGDEVVAAMPRGTLIVGSHGRVDLRGNNDEVMLIRDKEDHWQFAYRTNGGLKYEDLSADSLKAWIQKLV